MKTPEQMAEEFFENWQPEKPKYIRPKARQYALEKVTECFLAGYQAAKDQLADTNKMVTADYVETAINDAKQLIRTYKLEGDKDILIKALVAAYCSGVDAVDGYLRNSLSAYRNSIKRLQWISVKERNPEARKMVLVCHKTFGMQIGFIDDNHARPCRNRWIVYVREFEEDASNHVPKTGKYEHIEITHWMELPAAPKGKDE